MKRKRLLELSVAMLTLACCFSCSKDESARFETGNPLPGEWYAWNVDYEGYPMTFDVEIGDGFIEGSGLYCLEGGNAGTFVAKFENEVYEKADIESIIYNSKTYTGEFTLHYDGDPEEELYKMSFYYEPKRDKFTVIQLNFNVTFTRK